MKQKFKLLSFLGLSSLFLVGCSSSPSFESPSISGKKMHVVYKNNYKVTASVDNATFKPFLHDYNVETTADIDLTSDDLYLKINTSGTDTNKATKTQHALLYKDGDKYKYADLSSTEESEISSTDALGKLKETLKTYTTMTNGYLDLDKTFTCTTADQYIKDVVNYEKDYNETELGKLPEITSTKSGEGYKFDFKPKYVSYNTDQGVSNFATKEGTTDASFTFETNKEGLVTSYKQIYNQAQAMPIMNPAPEIYVTGTRELQVTYDATFTKANTLDRVTKIEFDKVVNGSFEAKQFAIDTTSHQPTDWSNPLTNYQDLDKEYIGIKPTPITDFKVKDVKLNGQSYTGNPTPLNYVLNGYYCFKVIKGIYNKISVEFEADVPTISYTGTNARVTVYKKLNTGNLQIVDLSTKFKKGDEIYIDCELPGTNSLTSIKVGETTLEKDSNVKKDERELYKHTVVSGENKIEVEVSGTEVAKAKVNVTVPDGFTDYAVKTFPYGQPPLVYTDLPADKEVTPANNLYGTIRAKSSDIQSIKYNGIATTVNVPDGETGYTYYCFPIKVATTFDVVVAKKS